MLFANILDQLMGTFCMGFFMLMVVVVGLSVLAGKLPGGKAVGGSTGVRVAGKVALAVARMLISGVIGYVNQLGTWGRCAVWLAGCYLFGDAVGRSGLLPHELGPWIVMGILLLASIIAAPWVERPARKQAEEKMNALLNTKDENLARERDGIMLRAYIGQNATPEQKQNDIRRLGAMLGDQKLGAAWIEEVEKAGARDRVATPRNLVPEVIEAAGSPRLHCK